MTDKKKSVNWTKAKVNKVVKLRAQGGEWPDIAAIIGETPEATRHAYRRRKSEDRAASHPLAGFTREALGDIIKNRRHKTGTFFVTSAQPVMHEKSPDTQWKVGENLHEPFFETVKQFCSHNDAELIILPTRAHTRALQDQPSHFDPKLEAYANSNFVTEYTFNRYLRALDAQINPQQRNPLTGIKSMGKRIERKSSLIIASPKQMLEVLPTGNESSPRLLASTGSLTVPQYLNNRVGRIAAADHVVGGLVITILGDRFLIAQVQCKREDGSFNYMGSRYFADGSVQYERAEAMKLGDIHAGHHDVVALRASYEMFATLKPKKIFIDDVFDGSSVSHHIEKDMIQRAILPEQFSTLSTEIEHCATLLNEIWTYAPEDAEVYITASNHNDFLDRYLRRGGYIKSPTNFKIGHEMVTELMNGVNPLKKRLDLNDNYVWLHENQDILVENIQMAAHGHLGPNGSRGNIKNQEFAYGQCMVGHSHTPGIFYGAYQVGHLSAARHGYNNGASSWVHCNGVVYKDGACSLLFIIDGEWM